MARTRPQTRYALAGDGVHIAYQILGQGDRDIVFVPGLMSHLDLLWEDAETAGFFERLATFGRLILFGYTWALIHHMLGGIRHLIWDIGYGFGPSEREWLARANLAGSIGLTIILWVVGYLVMGGPR